MITTLIKLKQAREKIEGVGKGEKCNDYDYLCWKQTHPIHTISLLKREHLNLPTKKASDQHVETEKLLRLLLFFFDSLLFFSCADPRLLD